MDKKSAIKLLDDTFNANFDLQQYTQFVKELFNNFAVTPRSWPVWQEYQDYIDSYQLLGSYKDNSKKTIDVLVVKLKRTSSRDRARTMQRNFIAKYLINADKVAKDAALVAFYGDDPQDWRFSFVKMEYQLAKEGKVKVELTPAKRYSFLVGVNEPNHTCREQLLNLVMEEEVNPSLEEIENDFSIDKVTKEFFNEYKELYLKLKESLEKVLEKNKRVQREFEEKIISSADFCKKLLGQIVFLYFLQKKGWLGVGVHEEWGTGPKGFIRRLYGDEQKDLKPLIQYDNFFNEVLEPLFYDALATDRTTDDHYYRLFKCKIPFLNGGLFEPINEYNWSGTDIILDNSIFNEILSTFDRFNFTVKEDEPLEKEVAVDPEMLGKVFENLLEVIDRKSKGAFYTPREIVHYMCQQSLINYLETNTKVSREDIEKFIQEGDLTLANSIRVLQEVDKKQEKLKKGLISAKIFEEEVKRELDKLGLPKSILENKELIDKSLKEIKVVDPAVGSGAFPVGMMNEIVKARSILSIYFKETRNDYDLKRETIENCLYGVDIESSAVEITKLRFWLSLIVDESSIKNIKPLPNLDHKIMCGNSLLEEFEGKKLFDEKLLGEVKKDISSDLNQITDEIAQVYQELGKIHTGKQKDQNGRSAQLKNEIKKLEKKRNMLVHTPAVQDRNLTLDDATTRRIKESQKKLSELKELQRKFFNEQNRSLKKQYRDQIDKLEWQLVEETLKEEGNDEAIEKLQEYKKNKSKPFFLWKLYFVEIFQRNNPGFDIVIGNPPYVRQEILGIEFKTLMKKIFPDVANGVADLYVYFFAIALKLCRHQGTIAYITPNKYLKTKYGAELRSTLNNYQVDEIIDFFELPVFEAANDTAITIILNKTPSDPTKYFPVYSLEKLDLISLIRDKPTNLQKNESEWIFVDDKQVSILNKITNDSILLKDYVQKKIYSGIKTAFNPAFVLSKETAKELLKTESKAIVKKYAQSTDIKKYGLLDKNKYFLATGYDLDIPKNYPSAFKFLKQFEEQLKIRLDKGKNWWNLRSCKYYADFEKPKIIYMHTAKKHEFFLDKEGYYINNSCYMIISDNKFLLSFLNSNLFEWYKKLKFVAYGNAEDGGRCKLDYNKMVTIPIKIITEQQQKPFIQLVDQILSITKDDDYLDNNPDKQAKVKRLEKEIDQLVYKL